MDELLEESGKFFKGLKIQTLCLLLTSTLLFASHAVIYELIPLETVVVELSDQNEAIVDPINFNIIPLSKYLVYESFLFRLPSQFVAKCLIQVGFYVGVFIGLCCCWFVFKLFRPKIVLVSCLSINAILVFINGFVPHYYSFVITRTLVGVSVAIGQASVALIFFDWSHHKNQTLSVHHQLGTRCVPLFLIGFMIQLGLEWRRYFAFLPCLIIVVVFLDLIFINESPQWLRQHGRLEEFQNLFLNLSSKLGKKPDKNTDVFADDMADSNPEKGAAMPSPPEVVQLIACYTLNALASLILQGSAGFYLDWETEIYILAVLQLLAYFVTTPLYSRQRIPLIAFTITSILLTTMLIFLPHGIMYGTLLQASKFNSVLNDHFALFFVMNICAPVRSDWRPMSSRIRREWRKKLLLVAETTATVIKPLAVFFVLQKDDSVRKSDRIPKLALCVACYGLELFLILAGCTFCARRNIEKPADTEKPLIPVSPPPQPDEPGIMPPADDSPDIVVSDEDDVDIDI